MKHLKSTKTIITVFSITFAALMLLAVSTNSEFKKLKCKTEVVYQTAIPKQGDSYETALEKANLLDLMKHYGVPGISFAIIKDGKLEWSKGYGHLQKGKEVEVNEETMFSVGSVSKVGAAVVILKLVSEGKLDLDTNVNNYLRSWKIEDNNYTLKKPVTLRTIMSHTSGLTVHGFADYLPHERLPTTVEILEGKYPAKNGPVYVNFPVGSRYRYSGGGTTVEQLLIEDVTKLTFHKATKDLLFTPLKMNRSSYQNPLPEDFGNIAKAHNSNGNVVALPRGYQAMPEAAASGLWTTPKDFSKLMIMLMNSYDGLNETFLPRQLVNDMMTKVEPSNYGLGPRIDKRDEFISFSHNGANDSYRADFTGFLYSKNGVIIFTNGRRGLDLIDEIKPILTKVLNTK
ncbi:serine hydrolase [uncultured Psychroserpens sp.]|uniref:serine hydrolase domain-containing protein n=1 Tax=uncultured Psychroserpens sp. TaxID=255436 RepID=UPI0026320FDF|nr:serine hydrolase domain-containing protein [uncultured Psychroserpens sp.]